MAGKAKALTSVVKLGVKYGPMAYETIKRGKEPAKEFAQKKLGKVMARKQAITHAKGLVDGSTMPVWEGDRQVWVVFNGDEPIASHPAATTPLPELIAGYDPAKRIRPTTDVRPNSNLHKALRRKS